MDLSNSTSPQNGNNNAEAAAPLDLTTQPIQHERIAPDYPSTDQSYPGQSQPQLVPSMQHPPTGQYSGVHQPRAELMQMDEAAAQPQPSLLYNGVSVNGPSGGASGSQGNRRLKTNEALIRLNNMRKLNVGMMLELEEYERRYDLPPYAKELMAKFRLLLAQDVGVKKLGGQGLKKKKN